MPRPLPKAAVAEFYRRLRDALPEPKTELDFRSPYTLVVAVALSAQATDVSVNKATRPLFEVADTPEKMLALGEEGLASYIRTIGLWRNKAKNVIALSRMIVEEFGGEVPTSREDLMRLPGVGRKTADVVRNVAFGHPTIAVDTHIFRVANRTGLAAAKTADAVSDRLVRRTPPEYAYSAHHWLILHGRYTCKARRPECWSCVVEDLCGYKDKTPAPQTASKTAEETAP
ncbi:endonuclease III [Parvularcula dongshanensis]|uniref:Endonuclease III n=1 Tax=Parvularcula dongshanensis TaxID=1173995 RepID=A0A840HZX4_9PROT|nr:endonuclease III [Parvularcula dongshanensis]MBB4657977.1 endonuclease-3 [Parvularcula dongshanensis]